jgi:hypothetical protein
MVSAKNLAGWVDGWKDGRESGVKDCLQQSKISECNLLTMRQTCVVNEIKKMKICIFLSNINIEYDKYACKKINNEGGGMAELVACSPLELKVGGFESQHTQMFH